MKKLKVLFIAAGLLLLFAFILTGCRGKSSDTSGQAQTTGSDQPSFNVAGSKQLVALSNTVAPATSTSGARGFLAAAFGSKEPFQYRIVSQGLTDQEIRSRAKGLVPSFYRAAATSQQFGTNLLAVDENGNATLAINSNYLVKVMYSVTDPKGEYVYLALDPGFIKPDGNDYTQFIGQNNCAFYRIKIADNSFTCVQNGVYVQPMDDVYLQRVSSSQKPIQFDSRGNVYFAATTFNRTCDNSGVCTMVAADWNPRIYRLTTSTGAVIALTQDNQKISYFMTLQTGEIAYQSIDVNGDIALYLWQAGIDPVINPNGKTINLTGRTVGVDYFAVDTYNTVMWGGWTENGIRFARPSASGLIEKASLDTNIFKTRTNFNNNFANYPALRVIIGDDGKLYGVFQDFVREPDPNDPNKDVYFSNLKVNQVLPYLSIPKIQVKIQIKDIFSEVYGGKKTWQQWMGYTPFQVSQGFIYYKEPVEKIGYGNHDVIKMVSLADRRTIPLLVNNSYEVYTWRLRGDKLYFSALDLDQTTVIAGEINTTIVKSNPLADPLSTFMTVKRIASALGATSRVQDIEALSALPTLDVSAAPVVKEIAVSPENLYSASIEFNKLMNPTSVENNMTFTDAAATSISTMKVWINNYLHLIPDLDVNNATTPPTANDALLDLTHTTPLSFGTTYSIAFGAASADLSGTTLGAVAAKSYTTRPENGWFVSSDKVGKFYGSKKESDGTMPQESYQLSTGGTGTAPIATLSTDFRFQFRVKNQTWGGLGISYYDKTSVAKPFVEVALRDYMEISYDAVQTSGTTTWNAAHAWARTADYNSQLWNGEWMYYRIDVYGSNCVISYSATEGGTYTVIPVEYYDYTLGAYATKDNVRNVMSRTAGHDFRLILTGSEAVDLDDMKLWNLSASGILGTLIWSEDFTSGTLPAYLKYENRVSTTDSNTPVSVNNPYYDFYPYL